MFHARYFNFTRRKNTGGAPSGVSVARSDYYRSPDKIAKISKGTYLPNVVAVPAEEPFAL